MDRELFPVLPEGQQPETSEPERGYEKKELSRAKLRIVEAAFEIRNTPPEQIAYQHTALCQTCLPYKDPGNKLTWERDNGHVSMLLKAGEARHPSGKWVQLYLPYGPKPRLILAYLNTQAILQQCPAINVEATLYAFIRKLKMDPSGRTFKTVKDQLSRLAAADMRLGVSTGPDSAMTQKGSIVAQFDLWLEKTPQQRLLWPRTVTLDERYFQSLLEHAVPLDERALAALSASSMAIDVYQWLAQRLHRVATEALVPWGALHHQFGEGFARVRDFRRKFKHCLGEVLKVYPTARLGADERGLVLRNSPPPILKRQVLLQGGSATSLTTLASKTSS